MLLVAGHAEDQDALLGMLPEDLLHDADAALRRDLEDQDIGPRPIDDPIRFRGLARFSDDLHVRLRRNQGAQSFAEQAMIVHQHQFDGHVSSEGAKPRYRGRRVVCTPADIATDVTAYVRPRT